MTVTTRTRGAGLLLALHILTVPALAGGLDAPGAPAAGSGMPTTADIYNRLNSGAAASVPGTFQEPTSGPTAGTGKTLGDIAAKLPAPDNTNGATASDVASSKTFWGLRTDGTWGLKSGTSAAGTNITGANGVLNIPIPDALYTGGKSAIALDNNLLPGNIRSGVTIFGVTGTLAGATANTAPIANAGAAKDVKTGTTTSLNGSASSDANGDPLTYKWTLVYKPAGSSAALSSTSVANPSLTTDVSGPYVLLLVVNDGKVDSSAAPLVVSAAALPVVTTTSPLNAATNVGLQTTVTATFDVALMAATVNTNTFTVSDGASNIAGTVSYSGNTATFTPTSSLLNGKTYTAVLTTGVSSSTGTALASNYAWTFTTAAQYVAVGGGCVYDNNNGLTWEVKTTDGGLRDWTNKYTNYDSPQSGQYWNGSAWVDLTQAELNASTNSVGYVANVNSSNLCGHNDWRMPTSAELQTLLSGSDPGPTIDTTWFPNTKADVYWSASPYGSNPKNGAYVFFRNRYVWFLDRSYKGFVRLVRTGQ